VDLIKLYGSMELAPLTGLADAIVDLVSTGNTLKANHLVEVEHIMDISSRLVVNQAALKLKRRPPHHRRLCAAIRPEPPSSHPCHECPASCPARPPLMPISSEFARSHWSADTDAAIEQRVADILADVQRAATPPCWSTPTLRRPAGRHGGAGADQAS
jgi:hypothetical protein